MSFENIQRSILPAKSNSLAPRQGLVFDGTTGCSATLTSAIGASSFTIDVVATIPTTNPAAAYGLFSIGTNGAAYACSSYIQSDGKIILIIVGATGSDYRYVTTSQSVVSQFGGKTIRITIVRDSSNTTKYIYINGVAAELNSDSITGSAPTWAGSITSTTLYIGKLDSTQYPYIGLIGTINPYNRALSAAEVLSLYESGAPSGNDLPGTAAGTAIASSAGVNAGNVLTSFTSSSGQWQGTVAVSTAPYVRYSTGQINVGNKFKVSGTVAFSGGTLDYFGVTQQGSGTGAGSLPTSNGNFNVTFTAHSYQASGLIDFFFAGNGVTVTVTNLVITPLGLLLAPDSNQPGGGLVWYDTSGNGANITLPSSGVRWNVPSSGKVASGWTFGGGLDVTLTQNAATISNFTNASTGGGAESIVRLTNNVSTMSMGLRGSGNSVYGALQASSGYLWYNGTTSLVIGATDAAGFIKFNTGGINETMRLFANGNLFVGSSPVDGGAKLQVNGTAAIAGQVSSTSGTTQLNIGVINGGLPYIQGYDGTTAANNGITFYTNTERMRLTGDGNLGIGVTPSAWGSSTMHALQISGPGSAITSALYSAGETNGFGLVSNAYYNGSNWKYIYSGGNFNATRYQLDTGIHQWYTSAAGASGNNVTWTKGMELDASSNLTIVGDITIHGGNFVLNQATGYATHTLIRQTSPSNGDVLGEFAVYGSDGTTYNGGIGIRAVATQNFGSTATGTELRFYTMPNSSAGAWWSQGAALTLQQNKDATFAGNLTVSGTGTSSFSGNVTVTGTGASYSAVDTGAFVKIGNNQTGANLQLGAQSGTGAILQGAANGIGAFQLVAQPYGGNFLIGTTSPSNYGGTFQVKGRQAWLPSTWTNASTDYLAWMNVDDSTNTFYIQTLQNNGTNGGYVSMQPNGGNVGIGTSTPNSKLDIYNSLLTATAITNTNSHLILSTPNNGTLQQTVIYFNPFNTSGNTSPSAISAIASGNTGSSLAFFTNPNNSYTATPTERGRFTPDGNFLVGTTGDGGLKFQVSGAANTTFTNNPALISVLTTDAQAANKGGGIVFGGKYDATDVTQFAYIGGLKDNSTSGNYAGKLVFGTRVHGTSGDDMVKMTLNSAGTLSVAGDLTVSGTGTSSFGGKIQSSVATATGYNQLYDTTGITTGRGAFGITSTGAGLAFGIESSVGGTSFTGSTAYASYFGSRTATPVHFIANDSIAATLTSSGNLGIGVTPSAWGSNLNSIRAIQLTGGAALYSLDTGTGYTALGNNVYLNSSGQDIYIRTGNYASVYSQVSGQHRWYYAASGTAGNVISFTQAMTLGNSGNLLVGTNDDNGSRLRVSLNAGGGPIGLALHNAGGHGVIEMMGTTAGPVSKYAHVVAEGTGDLKIYTNSGTAGSTGTLALTLDSSQNATFGGTIGSTNGFRGAKSVVVSSDTTVEIAADSGLGGIYQITTSGNNRVQRVLVSVAAQQYDNAKVSILSDYTYNGQTVLSNFRVTGNAGGTVRALVCDVGNRNGQAVTVSASVMFDTNGPLTLISPSSYSTSVTTVYPMIVAPGTATQNVTFGNNISVGGATPASSGAGITFPATQSASTDANTLDDYEEGTWTPTFAGTTTNPTVTYAVQTGWYTKIGRQVTVVFELGTSANTGGVGNIIIAGLPFTQNGTVRTYSAIATYNIDNPATNPLQIFIEGITNNTSLYLLYTADNSNWGSITWTNATSASVYAQASFTYFV